MENNIKIWVVKDCENNLRPLAGIWVDKIDKKTGLNYGEESAKEYQVKNKNGDIVVRCVLSELIN